MQINLMWIHHRILAGHRWTIERKVHGAAPTGLVTRGGGGDRCWQWTGTIKLFGLTVNVVGYSYVEGSFPSSWDDDCTQDWRTEQERTKRRNPVVAAAMRADGWHESYSDPLSWVHFRRHRAGLDYA